MYILVMNTSFIHKPFQKSHKSSCIIGWAERSEVQRSHATNVGLCFSQPNLQSNIVVSKSTSPLIHDQKIYSAVIKEFEIIGEAVGKLSEEIKQKYASVE